ncbi:hypothetical protein, partial [Aeromonas australiensis]|uniref:hypothetical protein n=1 Tax=Aeromonas australiensis TaxID=1114880 RepID=UPI001F22A788
KYESEHFNFCPSLNCQHLDVAICCERVGIVAEKKSLIRCGMSARRLSLIIFGGNDIFADMSRKHSSMVLFKLYIFMGGECITPSSI